MRSEPRHGVAGRAWVRSMVISFLAAAMVAAASGGSSAEPAGGATVTGSTGPWPAEGAWPWLQAPATIWVTPGAAVTTLSSSIGALTCVRSPAVVDAAGRMGVLAPQLGATVIRGSAAASPSVTWVVVPAGQVGGVGSVAVTICVPMR